MSRLIKIAGWGGAPRASVIFVHGLGGHAYDTWRRDTRRREAPDDVTFWPLWLAEDVDGISVYTMAYEAPASNWLGTSMPLQDRAVNVLEVLLSEPGLKSGPIVFICHSLGGLIVKQILLDLQQQKDRRKEAKDLLGRVTQVVFAATPHTGSRRATLLDRLRFFAWPSTIARTLVANDPALRSINVAYRGFADESRDVLQHRVFYETQGTPAGVIVDEASADPGLPGDPPVPVDADHISIVKPLHHFSVLYARTRDFIAKSNPVPETQEGGLEIRPLSPIQPEQPLNVFPKFIRIAAIGLVVLIGYKGVQALIAPTLPIDPKEIVQLKENIQQLTRQLITLNAANAGPALNHAVNEAVAATAKGAAEGDQRLQQAFDMLKANKIAEAAQLLQAVAADKSASIEKDRKDVAAAYRNLGAIAGLRDPAKALEAYAKALEFDPDDRDALYWRGWLSLQAGHLAVADQSLTLLLKLASEVGDQQGIYRASLRLGELALERGNLALDLEYQNKAEKVALEQTISNPANSEWQRNLSVSYEKIGDVQVAQGDLKAALKSYEAKRDIISRLAQSDPGNVDWRRDLSVSYEKVGDVQVVQGDLEAPKSYSDGLSIIERLAQSDPGNAQWQYDLGISNERIGDVQVAQGDLKAALKSYEAKRDIISRLAQSDPGNAYWQRDLSVSYAKLADAYRKSKETAKARDALAAGRAIIGKLVEQHPDQAQWKQDLAWFDARIAEQGKTSPKRKSAR